MEEGNCSEQNSILLLWSNTGVPKIAKNAFILETSQIQISHKLLARVLA